MASSDVSFLSRVSSKLSDCAVEAGHLGFLVTESALHAAIQDPLDATEQLINHISKPLTGYELPPLHLIDAPHPAKFGSADWVAETVGSGIGKAADIMLVATGLGALGATGAIGGAVSSEFAAGSVLSSIAGGAARAAVIGGVYGAFFTPNHDKRNFWTERGEDGLMGVIGGGIAGGIGYYAKDLFDGAASAAEEQTLMKVVGTKAAKSVVRGITSGITRTSVSAMFGIQPTEQAMAERSIQGIVRNAISDVAQ